MSGRHLTYYDVLGVPMNATRAEIQKAYKDQLVQSHPGTQTKDNDSTPYDPHVQADMQRVAWLTRAHAVLSNDALRRVYDAFLWTSGVQLTPDLHPRLAAGRTRRREDADADDDAAARRRDAANAPDDGGAVSRVHVDPATNARYEYKRSADGAAEQFAYYYDSDKDPSHRRSDKSNKSDRSNKSDADGAVKSGGDASAATTTARDGDDKETTTTTPLLPRRARVIEQQIHDAGHPLYSLCSVPFVGGVSLGESTIYVLLP